MGLFILTRNIDIVVIVHSLRNSLTGRLSFRSPIRIKKKKGGFSNECILRVKVVRGKK
jgi:hypothetical protein